MKRKRPNLPETPEQANLDQAVRRALDLDEDVEKLAPPECFVTAFNKKVYKALLERMKNSDKFSMSLLSDEFSTEEMGRISGIAAKKREVAVTRDVVADCAQVLKSSIPKADGELSNDELLELFRSKNK